MSFRFRSGDGCAICCAELATVTIAAVKLGGRCHARVLAIKADAEHAAAQRLGDAQVRQCAPSDDADAALRAFIARAS